MSLIPSANGRRSGNLSILPSFCSTSSRSSLLRSCLSILGIPPPSPPRLRTTLSRVPHQLATHATTLWNGWPGVLNLWTLHNAYSRKIMTTSRQLLPECGNDHTTHSFSYFPLESGYQGPVVRTCGRLGRMARSFTSSKIWVEGLDFRLPGYILLST